MKVIETTAHVGSDGMLHLVVPTEERDQDVKVAVMVEAIRTELAAATADRWADVRQRLEDAGIHVPPPGVDNPGRVVPLDLPGPAASEILIQDRR